MEDKEDVKDSLAIKATSFLDAKSRVLRPDTSFLGSPSRSAPILVANSF